jgi:ABC-2 type transport system permease protein
VTVATLFLGIGAIAYALTPRAGVALAYAAATAAFLWQLFGSLLGAPAWLIRLSPFEHIGLVPQAAFKLGDGAVMILIGLVCALVAAVCLARRDIAAG